MTQEELYKIESDYINELHNRRESAKNFTGQVAGRHSDMFSGHEMTWMTRGFLEGYVKAKESLYTDEDLEKVWSLAVENTLLKALNKPIEKTYYQLLEELKRK